MSRFKPGRSVNKHQGLDGGGMPSYHGYRPDAADDDFLSAPTFLVNPDEDEVALTACQVINLLGW